jgi:dTMP kinase
MLARSMRDLGRKVYVTKQPSDGPVGAMIRLALAKRLRETEHAGISPSERAEILALFFAADRKDHYHNTVGPLLRQGVVVISDRYDLSTFAFQGVDVRDSKWLRAINSKVMRPDLTVLLDVEPMTCMERIERRSGHYQLYEHVTQLERVHRAYLDAVDQLRQWGDTIVVIDGNRSTNEVHRSVLAEVRAGLASQTGKPASSNGLFPES